MATRPRKKRRRSLERWQVLLAAAVAAIASIIVALINLTPGGSSQAASIAITGLVKQPYPPPPGRLYLWTGTVHDQPPGAEVFVIDKRAGQWLVSPAAIISGDSWTIDWTIPAPPTSAQWVAIMYVIGGAACPLRAAPQPPQDPASTSSPQASRE